MTILEETRKMVYAARDVGKEIDKLTLSFSRLDEFLLAAVSNRCMTTDEIEQMRQSCIQGEAKVWGVPVEFKNEPSN